jgi:biotin-(acetyl-CoA carboxylase) ligase
VLTLAGKLKDFVLTKIEDLKKGNFDQMLQEYNEHLYGRNCLIKLKKESVVFETTIRAVSESGQLITWDVLERRFNFDEVSFRGLI